MSKAKGRHRLSQNSKWRDFLTGITYSERQYLSKGFYVNITAKEKVDVEAV